MTKAIFIFLVFALIIGGCFGGTLDNEIIPPNPENTATPTLIVKAAPPTSTNEPRSSFQHIASGQIAHFVWGSESNKVFYRFLGGSVWEYNLNNESNNLIGDNFPLKEEPQDIPNFTNLIFDFGYSPSGEKGLYLILLYPTPTIPPPAMAGEDSGYKGSAELWYWEDGNTSKLGIISSCIRGYLWSHDESIIVIQPDTRRGCDNMPLAWMVDLNTNIIDSLDFEETGPLTWIASFSPDDQSLLYVRDNTLSIIDINTFEVRKLETPELGSISGQWISDQILLISYLEGNLDDYRFLLGLFDINTFEFTPLLDDNYPEVLEGQSVVYTAISPDKMWVAFTIGAFPWEVEGLWLLRLAE